MEVVVLMFHSRFLADKDDCTGCELCANICPKNAVIMKPSDKDGFWYPFVDWNKCVQCGICEKLCPVINPLDKHGTDFYSKVYAANALNEDTREWSASGGIFPTLAEKVLEADGCVAGVVWENTISVKYKLICNVNQLNPLRGTKYFQSRMSTIYNEIEQKLNQGKKVLFCGTPCQVRAVLDYCRSRHIEEGLILVDLLCRGVPSPKAYAHWISEMERKRGEKVSFVQIKEKKNGWHNIGTRITYADGGEEYYALSGSSFMDSFVNDNMSIRESCFHCQYKSVDRISDLTIGDFWGYHNPALVDDKGTSIICINSKKGQELFDSIRNRLKIRPSTMWRAVRGNVPAFEELEENKGRTSFWNYLEQYDLTEALRKARK